MRTVLIFNILILILSLFTIIKGIFGSKKNSRYFIINNEKNLIDERSLVYCDKKKLNDSINFVRSTRTQISLRAYFKFPNIIFINSIEYFADKLNSKILHFFLFLIFKIFRVTKLYMIDDYRYLNIFIPICNKLNIYTIGYMHGRFSSELKYQRPLSKYTFDKYYIWSRYFKKKLLEINSNYRNKKIIIYNKFKNLIVNKKKNKKKNIIFLEEAHVPISFFFKFSEKILAEGKYEVMFKFRPNNKINVKILNFCIKNKIKTFHKVSFEKLLTKRNISAIVATNSTALLNASYFDIFPICIVSKYSLNYFIKEKIVFPLKIEKNLPYQLKKIFSNKKKLNNIKKKIW